MANELRRWANWVGGLVEDNPLAAAATTLTSSGLAALPAVASTEHYLIVFDPDGITGAPFAKRVTAHTAGATTATIEAAAIIGTARQIDRDVPWVHSLVAGDFGSHAAYDPTANTTAVTPDAVTWTAFAVPFAVSIDPLGLAVRIDASVNWGGNAATGSTVRWRLLRGATELKRWRTQQHGGSFGGGWYQDSHFHFIDDTPALGSNTYSMQVLTPGGAATVTLVGDGTEGDSYLSAQAIA